MRYVIQGGELIDPANNIEEKRDLIVVDGVIEDVVPPNSAGDYSGAEVVDAAGCWVVPGLIDLHVHLREPGYEWKSTVADGARAAVVGGYTAICCMPNTSPVNDNAEITEFILKQAAKAKLARVYPIGAVTLGSKGEAVSPYGELREAGCVALSDDGEPIYDGGIMRRALEWAAHFGIAVACHEEDKALSAGGVMNESELSVELGLKGWPVVAEDVMVARDIELSRYCHSRVHICHISSARGVELVRRAKNDGIPITAEVTPHHLFLSEENVRGYDTCCKMMPPLRGDEEIEALRAGIADGTIDAIASDHAPHEFDSKAVPFDEASVGLVGLQTNLPLSLELVREGVISKKRCIELLTSGGARCFGLSGGNLSKGSQADIAIIDPDAEYVLKKESLTTKSKNTPFLDRELRGLARDTMVGGRFVVRERALVEEEAA